MTSSFFSYNEDRSSFIDIHIFPVAYFGSIAYFQFLAKQSTVEIEIWDTFEKQTFRNRATIETDQGALRLTVPVERPNGSKTLTKDILISTQTDWQSNHWRAIRSAYSSAPYFDYYECDIRSLILTPTLSLVELNLKITQFFIDCFELNCELKTTNEYQKNVSKEFDFRTLPFDDNSIDGFESKFYSQVYYGEKEFQANRSIIDLLFCEGPMGRKWLVK